jgi:4-hydroxythreonine-4-phosphate dehydrogenase
VAFVKRPVVAITMGDPAGIGPEIAVKALANEELLSRCRPFVVGTAAVLRDALRIVSSHLEIRLLADPQEAEGRPGELEIYDLETIELNGLSPGMLSAAAGRAAFEAIKKAIEMAVEDRIDAVVTGPIHKEALRLAGVPFPGHTEILAHYTGTPPDEVAMMLAYEGFRVVHVSGHVSMKEAVERVTRRRVRRTIELAFDGCRSLGISRPRIAVAGLNPHASDGGLFGDEEAREIAPAVEDASRKGIPAEGPLPPDTLFPKARAGFYDAVVAMYHDQGHIPLKMAGFSWNQGQNRWDMVDGINVTLGLPIVRCSVDHGTAFDIAGRGVASEKSLIRAVECAASMADAARGKKTGP